MPSPVSFAPTATRVLPNSAPRTVQELIRRNEGGTPLTVQELVRRGDYAKTPSPEQLPGFSGGQGSVPNPTNPRGQAPSPSSPSGRSGGWGYMPIGMPQSPSPYGTGNSSGFNTRADFDAWQRGESRQQIEAERSANEHFDRFRDSLGGPGSYRIPGETRSNDELLRDANKYRSRNGLAPLNPNGFESASPGGLGGLGSLGDAVGKLGDLAGKLFPGGNPDTASDPFAIPNPLDTSDRGLRPYKDPFAPLNPDLPGNPFAPGSPGGAVNPGSDPVSYEETGIWHWTATYNKEFDPHPFSISGSSLAVPSFGVANGQWHVYQLGQLTYRNYLGAGSGHVPSMAGLRWENTTPKPSPATPPTVWSAPPRPTSPIQNPSTPSIPASPNGSAPGVDTSSRPGSSPYNPLQPSSNPNPSPSPKPSPSPSPSPDPFRFPLPIPVPVPSKPSPAPTGTTPFRSPNPNNAPKPIGGASPSPSPSPSPSGGSASGSSGPIPPPSCGYREDETQAVQVDYVVVTPVGRLKKPKTIQTHEKMAEATQLQFEVLGQMRESLDKIEKNTKIAKVMHMVSMATTIHNAMMLSRDLAETLGNVTSSTFTAVGRMTGVVGESDFVNVNEILGSQFNEFMEKTLGKELWAGTKESWLKASRIYQSGANIVNSVRDIADSTRDIGEFTAQNVSKIGNALRKFRVVGWDAYPTMDENARAKSRFFRTFDKAIEKGERLENAASSLGSVSGNVLSIQDEIKDIKENRDAFKKGIEEWNKKDESKQKKEESESKINESLSEDDLK